MDGDLNQQPLDDLDELDYDSQRENSAIKRVKDHIKCVPSTDSHQGYGNDGKMLAGSMSDFLRGHDEEKYGGFDQEEDEELSIRDYQNESDGVE